jgi:hypothetical protein
MNEPRQSQIPRHASHPGGVVHTGLLAGAILFRPVSPFRGDLPTRLDGAAVLIIDGEKDSRRSPGDGACLAERLTRAGAMVSHCVMPVAEGPCDVGLHAFGRSGSPSSSARNVRSPVEVAADVAEQFTPCGDPGRQEVRSPSFKSVKLRSPFHRYRIRSQFTRDSIDTVSWIAPQFGQAA